MFVSLLTFLFQSESRSRSNPDENQDLDDDRWSPIHLDGFFFNPKLLSQTEIFLSLNSKSFDTNRFRIKTPRFTLSIFTYICFFSLLFNQSSISGYFFPASFWGFLTSVKSLWSLIFWRFVADGPRDKNIFKAKHDSNFLIQFWWKKIHK